jgi:acyl dehydratase
MRTGAQLGGPWAEPATFHKPVKPKSTVDTSGTCTHIDPIWPWGRDHQFKLGL